MSIANRQARQVLQASLLLVCTACTVGPVYTPPCPQTPLSWQTPPSEGMDDKTSPALFCWSKALQDPILDALLAQAASQNLDLAIASSRLLQARLKVKGEKAERYPHIDASACGGDLLCSRDVLKHSFFKKNASRHTNSSFFEFGFDASWEIDLFGYRTHYIQAAAAKAEAAQASFEEVWIVTSAEIARYYIELRGAQERKNILLRTINMAKEHVELTQELSQSGMATSIEALQAEEQLHQLQAQQSHLDHSIDNAIHKISILLGLPPGDLFAQLAPPQPLPQLPDRKPIGIPSEAVQQRADVRRAERNLAASTEEEGAAAAALFPRFTLFGFAGEVATRLRSFANGDALTLFAAPQLLLPLFNSKLLKEDVKYSRHQTFQALCEYQKCVLSALEEVESGLTSFRYNFERLGFLAKAQELSREIYQLSYDLYRKGLTGYREVLASCHTLLNGEDAALQTKIDLLLDYISLYKALGGGWLFDESRSDTIDFN